MDEAIGVLRTLKRRGCNIRREGQKLFVAGPLTDELRMLIRAHKKEILEILASGVPSFCPGCGKRTLHVRKDDEEAKPGKYSIHTCVECGFSHYMKPLITRVLEAFPGSAAVYYEKASEEEGIESNGEE
ncbi:MAG: hypothetical protein HPY68_04635 [Candidatus Atribacteria bacterium]|nr:hypothetical protein [Candidatus Atribacteria bacterium]